MSIQTDDFAPAPRMVSAAPASPKEEAIERALRPKLLAAPCWKSPRTWRLRWV
ncbi:hypothetical protein J2W49_004456 [Hydrogenophaga palleronii]|uniref:Uncharacterized protein n=1 Tax=Hydrogenophaga palleronii TaxID=65655 RepID=A0ABU1WT69_9BURK|nr:hypothetical protein [Hydrogenophaga palleronii]